MVDLTDFIQQVKRANDIVDVIGSYLELRHNGSANFVARCPFTEKNSQLQRKPRYADLQVFRLRRKRRRDKIRRKVRKSYFYGSVGAYGKARQLKMPETLLQKQG